MSNPWHISLGRESNALNVLNFSDRARSFSIPAVSRTWVRPLRRRAIAATIAGLSKISAPRGSGAVTQVHIVKDLRKIFLDPCFLVLDVKAVVKGLQPTQRLWIIVICCFLRRHSFLEDIVILLEEFVYPISIVSFGIQWECGLFRYAARWQL